VLASDPCVRLAVSTVFDVAHEHGQMLTPVCWGAVVELVVQMNRFGLVRLPVWRDDVAVLLTWLMCVTVLLICCC